MARLLSCVVAGLLVLGTVMPAAAQANSPLQIAVSGASSQWQPVVRLNGLLGDPALRNALHSGLPLRLHLRVELWRDAIFDRLTDAQETNLVLSYDPLDRSYLFEDGRAPQRVATLAEAESLIGAAMLVPIRPQPGARYYYLALLEVETLSLSDLEELRHWLRGEARDALEGRRAVGRAVEQGLRRAFVRVVGLSARRYEARTPTFAPR
jgi:hypothetical protein